MTAEEFTEKTNCSFCEIYFPNLKDYCIRTTNNCAECLNNLKSYLAVNNMTDITLTVEETIALEVENADECRLACATKYPDIYHFCQRHLSDCCCGMVHAYAESQGGEKEI